MTGVWVTNDTISATRMNEKTIFQGTGAAISGLTTYAGMIVFCTSTGSGFTVDITYQRNNANTAWIPIGVGQLPYITPSTTIGDYTSPSSATASSTDSSTDTATVFNQAPTAAQIAVGDGSIVRAGVKVLAGSAGIGSRVKKVKFTLKKTGSPTGTLYVKVRDSTDAVVATASMDVSTLTTSFVVYEFTLDAYRVLASLDRIQCEYVGDASNYAAIQADNVLATTPAGYNRTYYIAGYTDDTYNIASVFDSTPFTNSAAFVYDDSTSTNWFSASVANPSIYVDLSSAREIVGIALNINKTSTTVTSLKIRASTDTSFDDTENIAYVNISDFTDDTWRYLANNFISSNRRYVQFYANETGVLSINEIKVRYGVTDLVKIMTHLHRTRNTSAADSFVDTN